MAAKTAVAVKKRRMIEGHLEYKENEGGFFLMFEVGRVVNELYNSNLI